MSTRTYFVLFDGVILDMASTLLFIDRIPVRVTQKLRYFISACSKNDFSILHFSPLSLRFCSVSSKFSKRSDQSPLVITNRSLIYAWIHLNPRNIFFIFSCKISGELLNPSVRRLYRYFTHGRIIVHKLLA